MDYINLLNEKILKDVIYPTLGKDTTYLHQLDQFGKSLFGKKFKGCYPSDQIPKLTDLEPYCILNLDNSKQNGSHWVGVCKVDAQRDEVPRGTSSPKGATRHRNETYIYDSFGRANKKIIPTLKKSGNGKIHDTDRDVEQEIWQLDCGQRSMAFLCLCDGWGIELAKKL